MPIHDNYLKLDGAEREIVDTGFTRIYEYITKETSLHAENGDDAERLVEAIATYLIESNK